MIARLFRGRPLVGGVARISCFDQGFIGLGMGTASDFVRKSAKRRAAHGIAADCGARVLAPAPRLDLPGVDDETRQRESLMRSSS